MLFVFLCVRSYGRAASVDGVCRRMCFGRCWCRINRRYRLTAPAREPASLLVCGSRGNAVAKLWFLSVGTFSVDCSGQCCGGVYFLQRDTATSFGTARCVARLPCGGSAALERLATGDIVFRCRVRCEKCRIVVCDHCGDGSEFYSCTTAHSPSRRKTHLCDRTNLSLLCGSFLGDNAFGGGGRFVCDTCADGNVGAVIQIIPKIF